MLLNKFYYCSLNLEILFLFLFYFYYFYFSLGGCVKLWVDAGIPKEKLIIGVPFYGHGYTLKDPKQNELNAPIEKEEGQWPYRE